MRDDRKILIHREREQKNLNSSLKKKQKNYPGFSQTKHLQILHSRGQLIVNGVVDPLVSICNYFELNLGNGQTLKKKKRVTFAMQKNAVFEGVMVLV